MSSSLHGLLRNRRCSPTKGLALTKETLTCANKLPPRCTLGAALCSPAPVGVGLVGLVTLETRGLRGIGIHSTPLQGFRHPRPAEVGFLNSLPPGFKHLPDLRAALCLVGQLAAPLQALWVYAQIRRWAEITFTGRSSVDPGLLVEKFKMYLLQSRADQWEVPSLRMRYRFWLCRDGVLEEIAALSPVQVCQVVAAERALLGPGLSVVVRHGDRRLPPNAFLHPNTPAEPYILRVQPKRACLAKVQPEAMPSQAVAHRHV